MKDIVYRLQEMALRLCGATMEAAHTHRIEWEAAATIEALRAENARLREALKPLAALRKEILDEKGQPSGDFSFDHYTDDQTVFFLDTKRIITAGDIRTAYQLLRITQ